MQIEGIDSNFGRTLEEAVKIYMACRRSLPDNSSRYLFSFFEGCKFTRIKEGWERKAQIASEFDGWKMVVFDHENIVRAFDKGGKEDRLLKMDLFRSM